MRALPSFLIAAGLIVVLAGCTSVALPTREQDRAVTSTDAFIAYLNEQGIGTDEIGFITEPFFEAQGKAFRLIGEDLLHVYEYDDEKTAQLDADKVNLNQFGTGRLPQVYQRGRLLVAFFGRNADLRITLTNVLGPPIT